MIPRRMCVRGKLSSSPNGCTVLWTSCAPDKFTTSSILPPASLRRCELQVTKFIIKSLLSTYSAIGKSKIMNLLDFPGGQKLRTHLPACGTWIPSWFQKLPQAAGQLSLCTQLRKPAGPRASAPQQENHCNREAHALQPERVDPACRN